MHNAVHNAPPTQAAPLDLVSEPPPTEAGYLESQTAPPSELVKPPSQSTMAVALVRDTTNLLCSTDNVAYIEDKKTFMINRIEGKNFKAWLTATFHTKYKKTINNAALMEACQTLAGYASQQKERVTLWRRCAVLNGTYYLDLCLPNSAKAVAIDANGWQLIAQPPVKFIRTNTMKPLVEPVQVANIKTSLEALWSTVNIPQPYRLVVLAWLCDALRPDTPYPVLELVGEQGSGKSSTQATLRRLIDPNEVDLRGAPKIERDIFVAAGTSHVVSYENLSLLPSKMQDCLCTIATGGGIAGRALYSDGDEYVIKTKNPIILNGIGACVTQDDLADRTVSIELPMIAQRREARDLTAGAQEKQGEILGALLELLSQALKVLPTVTGDNLPRMMEYARLGIAIERALDEPHGSFLSQLNARQDEVAARTLEDCPVARALQAWSNAQRKALGGAINMDIKLLDLLEALKSHSKSSGRFPQTPKALGDKIRRIAPALRKCGLECTAGRKIGGVLLWNFRQHDEETMIP